MFIFTFALCSLINVKEVIVASTQGFMNLFLMPLHDPYEVVPQVIQQVIIIHLSISSLKIRKNPMHCTGLMHYQFRGTDLHLTTVEKCK